MATLEELTTEATTEINAKKTVNGGNGMFIQINNDRREYTEAEYDQAITDLANSKWNDQQFGYIQARQEAYSSIAEQLDMQYWDAVNGTTVWKDHVAQVKSDNPKPA
jgi:hypothetical protein